MYVGGGTPSLLEPNQLRRLLHIIRTNFTIDEGDEHFRCFESHPMSMDEEKLDVLLNERFVNRVSFGIQSLNKSILDANDRVYTPLSKLATLLSYIRATYTGVKVNINVDLMIGLDGEDIASLLESFTKLAELKVRRITVYCNRCRERLQGNEFRQYAVSTIGSLARHISERHKNYHPLCSVTKYNDVYAWGLEPYESYLYRYFYNSSALAYNNNLGLGLGSISHIIASGVSYVNSHGSYVRREFLDRNTVTEEREKSRWYTNSFNF
jgi:coproporphyrinogen III oxidase-like Fe-S oxidoreductase